MPSTAEKPADFPKDPALKTSFGGHSRPVAAVAFHSNSKQLISGSLDGTILVHFLSQQLRPIRSNGHKEAIYCLAFETNQGTVASGSRDKTVRLWQPTVLGSKESRAQIIRGHHGPVRAVAFNKDGRLLLTASDDKIAKVWVLPDGHCSGTLTGHSNWVRCGQLTSDGGVAVTGSDDRTLKLWDTSSKRCMRSFSTEAGVFAAAFCLNEARVAAGCADGAIRLWDTRAADESSVLQDHEASVTSLCCHPRDQFLLSSSLDGSLKLWDLRRRLPLYTLRAHDGAVLASALSPDGNYIASGGADQRTLLWHMNGGTGQGSSLPRARSGVAAEQLKSATSPNSNSKPQPNRVQKKPTVEGAIKRQVSNAAALPQSGSGRSWWKTESEQPSSSTAVYVETMTADAWKGWPAVQITPSRRAEQAPHSDASKAGNFSAEAGDHFSAAHANHIPSGSDKFDQWRAPISRASPSEAASKPASQAARMRSPERNAASSRTPLQTDLNQVTSTLAELSEQLQGLFVALREMHKRLDRIEQHVDRDAVHRSA